MGSYTGTVDGKGRATAIAGVVAIHLLLGFIILSGLNISSVHRVVERLTTLDVVEPDPPPPIAPPPKPTPDKPLPARAIEAAGAPAKKADPTLVVVPHPKIPLQSPIPAATVAGTGSAISSGAGLTGNGSGAGGAGNGPGGGGGGGSGGFTPARRISKIPDRAYRQLAATGIVSGSVGVTILVNPDGSVSNCRIARSSGDRRVDSMMCDMTLRYVRFDPARDPSGRPVGQDISFFPNWWRP